MSKNLPDYHSAIANAPIAIFLTNSNGLILSGNYAACQLFGYSEEEFQQKRITDFVDQTEIGSLQKEENERQNTTLTSVLKKNGECIQLECTSYAFFNDCGEQFVSTTMLDITARKKSEAKIRQSEILLAEAQRLAKLGSWSFDFKEDVLTWSDELYNVFGIDRAAFSETHGSFLSLIDHKDKARAKETSLYTQQTGTPFTIEYQITTPSGIKKTILEHGYGEKDEEGNIIRLFGTAQDITESKRHQEELKHSEEKYRILFEKSPMPKWIYDLESLQIMDVNMAAIHQYGYNREEFLSLTLHDLTLDWDKSNFATKGKVNGLGILDFGLVTHQKKNKSIIRVEVSGNKFSHHGRECMMVLCNDVTERELTLDILLDREMKLDDALRIARLGYWRFDLKNDDLFWSPEVFSIWECKADQPNFDFFLSSIHPDDLESFLKVKKISLGGEAELDLEHRIVMADGSVKWVHEKGHLEQNEQGEHTFLTGTVQDITAQKLLALSLAESNQRYKYVTKATSDAIWDWDLTTDFCYWGEGIETIFGYRHDVVDGGANFWKNTIHPDDIEHVMTSIKAVIKGTQNNWSADYRFQKSNQEYAYVVDKGFIIRNEQGTAVRMVGAMQDITKQKQREEHLKLLESVIINASDSVMITNAASCPDEGLKIVYINEAFTRMTGYSPEEVLGNTPEMLQGPKSCSEELTRLTEAIKVFKPCTIITINYKKNGDEFWIHLSFSPLSNEKGTVTHWIAIARDVTKEKLTAIRLKTLNETLEKQTIELSVSNRELEQFAFIASHDLQEPLRMVTSFLALLEKKYLDSLDDDGKKYIHFAVDGAKRMRQLILDLLEYSRVCKVENDLNKVDLGNIIEEIRILFRAKIAEVSGEIIIGHIPIIHAQQVPLRQVFQNLISNALKYSKSGVHAEIHIECNELPQDWQFSVADNGIGIDNAYLDKIFILFQRLHKKNEYSGTGIGLAICKKIIENLGGKIWVNSNPGLGSIFYFTIPKITPLIIS